MFDRPVVALPLRVEAALRRALVGRLRLLVYPQDWTAPRLDAAWRGALQDLAGEASLSVMLASGPLRGLGLRSEVAEASGVALGAALLAIPEAQRALFLQQAWREAHGGVAPPGSVPPRGLLDGLVQDLVRAAAQRIGGM